MNTGKENQTWTVAGLRGAVLAGALLALSSAFGDQGTDLVLALVLCVAAGFLGGAGYSLLVSREDSRWWHYVAGIILYTGLVSLAFFLGTN